jgi:NitT/TauT family transport system substrate-binding protein
MPHCPLTKRLIVCGLAVIALTYASSVNAQQPTEVRLLMNWFAQADQSGFWQAAIDDAGKPYGIKIVTLAGGPKIQTIPQVAAGQAEFGVANADDVLLARLHGAPVRAVFVSMDYVPYDLVYHPNPAVKSLTDLNGKTFAVTIGAAYWEWLKKHYGLKVGHEIPITGDLSLFKNDPNMVQQGYSLFLPARMTEAGIPNAQFKVAQLGYRPYEVLFTTDDMIQKHPQLVRNTIAAVKQSWSGFMNDPTKVKSLELRLNKQISSAVYDQAVKQLISDLLPKDHAKIGCMTDARWQELEKQLEEVKFLPAGFDVTKAYDRSFVTGCSP